jgi:hypothetical protein
MSLRNHSIFRKWIIRNGYDSFETTPGAQETKA